MASSYGTDAGVSALEARYVSVLPMAVSPTSRGISAALESLVSLDIWKSASVVLLPTPDMGPSGFGRVAARALEEDKRLGIAVRWETTGQDGTTSGIDFVEAISADTAMLPAETVDTAAATAHPEGDAIGFTCDELLGSLCVVPGLVFDGEGHYVGSDGGAYARFLRFFPGHKVALVDTLQVSSNPLPHSPADIPVDYLVTPSGVWACR